MAPDTANRIKSRLIFLPFFTAFSTPLLGNCSSPHFSTIFSSRLLLIVIMALTVEERERYSRELAEYTMRQFTAARKVLDNHQAAAAKLPALHASRDGSLADRKAAGAEDHPRIASRPDCAPRLPRSSTQPRSRSCFDRSVVSRPSSHPSQDVLAPSS
ncbi:hypothetical protein B0H11DRAFT_310527 [Mycena galericulata]|nr:hypothetical protein B0H11DRAFT_310527 [Mycena galericulata]